MPAQTTFMSPAEAKNYRLLHDAEAKTLNRQTKAQLELIARNRGIITWGNSSKAELVSDILRHRYPLERLNESIHVMYHVDGLTNSACEWC